MPTQPLGVSGELTFGPAAGCPHPETSVSGWRASAWTSLTRPFVFLGMSHRRVVSDSAALEPALFGVTGRTVADILRN
ncbi:hypothetical protein GCM10010275_03410 [Streptomyces litmocidini]|nr:hypothetical protein GCM10010275_03410 [Streptomyces litmocidini]